MSSAEVSEWQRYARIEPFGEERADLRAALIAMLIANANRDTKKHPRPFGIDEFLLFGEPREPRERTPEEIAAMFGAPD